MAGLTHRSASRHTVPLIPLLRKLGGGITNNLQECAGHVNLPFAASKRRSVTDISGTRQNAQSQKTIPPFHDPAPLNTTLRMTPGGQKKMQFTPPSGDSRNPITQPGQPLNRLCMSPRLPGSLLAGRWLKRTSQQLVEPLTVSLSRQRRPVAIRIVTPFSAFGLTSGLNSLAKDGIEGNDSRNDSGQCAAL